MSNKPDAATLIYEAVEAAFDEDWSVEAIREDVERAIEAIEAENAQP